MSVKEVTRFRILGEVLLFRTLKGFLAALKSSLNIKIFRAKYLQILDSLVRRLFPFYGSDTDAGENICIGSYSIFSIVM